MEASASIHFYLSLKRPLRQGAQEKACCYGQCRQKAKRGGSYSALFGPFLGYTPRGYFAAYSTPLPVLNCEKQLLVLVNKRVFQTNSSGFSARAKRGGHFFMYRRILRKVSTKIPPAKAGSTSTKTYFLQNGTVWRRLLTGRSVAWRGLGNEADTPQPPPKSLS